MTVTITTPNCTIDISCLEPLRPFATDNRRLIGLRPDNRVGIYDSATGEELQNLGGHEVTVDMACFASSGEFALTANRVFERFIWSSGKARRIADDVPRGKVGRTFLSELESGRPVFALGYQLLPIVVPSLDLRYLAITKGSIIQDHENERPTYETHVFDTTTNREIRQFEDHYVRKSCPVTFDPTNSFLVTASEFKFWFWRLSDGGLSFAIGTNRDPRSCALGKGSVRAGPNELIFCPNGRLVAARLDADPVEIWSIEGHQILTLGAETKGSAVVGFDDYGDRLLTVARNRYFEVYNVRSGELKFKAEGGEGSVPSACISPDGNMVGISDGEGGASIYSVEDGQLLWKLTCDEPSKLVSGMRRRFVDTRDVFFSPNNELVVTGRSPIRVWKLL